ncbi:MAG: hypothetical protein IJX38_02235 [Clostridia bacterium]|nr:hypothetical protein [Clostridia bacterium]MBQ8371747.1 hypothetical protein [Clostridia bacterium]
MKKIFPLLAILLLTVIALFACSCGDPAPEPQSLEVEYTLEQVGESQTVDITWSADVLLTKLEVTVSHGSQVVDKQTFEGYNLSDRSVSIEAYYGRHTVSLKAYADGYYSEKTEELVLSADEYVIAPISGSMPQLYFTLYMDEITKEHTIPAFVWLTRPGSWNWEKLPENVYAMPNVDISEVLTHDNFSPMVESTDAYIEELYSINPNSKFNLYINDFNAYLYLRLLVANGIPEDNYYVTLLSDGGASNSSFNAVFNIDEEGFDADPVYAEMVTKLDGLYDEVKDKGTYYYGDEFSVSTTEFNSYAYVCAKEKDNVEWWLPRPRGGVLCSTDAEFIDTVLNIDTVKSPHENREDNVIIERNFANPLTNLNEEETASLKALYNFSDDMFAAAEEQGKKAMMILGSWVTEEPDFENYVKLVKAYYGDEFVYYYKGHPNTPTALYPEKQEQLDRLGLIDVESSINAELILFFYPDIYMCGYTSSTFTSVFSEEMACALFNVSLDKAYADEGYNAYRHLIGFYSYRIIPTEPSDYSELCTNITHSYFVLEFNRDDKPADIAIFDANDETLTYYNLVDGEYVKANI